MNIGKLIVREIKRYNIDKIFGVPGDYNLQFLDEIIECPGIDWVGNTNELNASYAADGYARVKGIGVLVTTFGVGELSAINGIAGAYAERVPIVQIVGSPSTQSANKGEYCHHTLGEGKYDDFINMYKPISVYRVTITKENAMTEIKYAIKMAYIHKRPVHINLPIDVANKEIEVFEDESIVNIISKPKISNIIKKTEELLNDSKSPVVIVGHEINAFNLNYKIEKFIEKTNLPIVQLNFGKGAANELSNNFLGTYCGKVSEENVKNYVDNSDLILNIGGKLTDAATAQFSQGFKMSDVIHINENKIYLKDVLIERIPIDNILTELLKINYLYKGKVSNNTHINLEKENYYKKDLRLTQKSYENMLNEFIEDSDVIIADQGTSFFVGANLRITTENTFISQPLWGSIGYSLPALLGSQLANINRRNILLIGDGAIQLTVQEFSTILRWRLKPIIFIVNNDGYTIERKIHGKRAIYNSIPMWNYTEIPKHMGNESDYIKTYKVKTQSDLKNTLKAINTNNKKMHIIEVLLDKDDVPKQLLGLLGD